MLIKIANAISLCDPEKIFELLRAQRAGLMELVVVNVRSEDERARGERLVADLVRLRKEDAVFSDVLGFHGNRIPSPKVYWRDSGLLHALLNVPDDRALLVQPWVGASWEGFVIEQALGELSSRGRNFEAYYFRTSDRHELGLVLDLGRERWAIEVKLTASPGPRDMGRLDKTADMIGASRRFLVSQTRRSTGDDERASCNLLGLIERLRQWPG